MTAFWSQRESAALPSFLTGFSWAQHLALASWSTPRGRSWCGIFQAFFCLPEWCVFCLDWTPANLWQEQLNGFVIGLRPYLLEALQGDRSKSWCREGFVGQPEELSLGAGQLSMAIGRFTTGHKVNANRISLRLTNCPIRG